MSRAIISSFALATLLACGQVPATNLDQQTAEPASAEITTAKAKKPTLEVEGPAFGLAVVADLTKTNAYLAPFGLEAISPDGNVAIVGLSSEHHRDLYTLGEYSEFYVFIVASVKGSNPPQQVNFFTQMITDSSKAQKFWQKHFNFGYGNGAIDLEMQPGAVASINATQDDQPYFAATMGQRDFATLTPDNGFSGTFGFASSTDASAKVYSYTVNAVGYTTPFDASKGDSFAPGPQVQALLDTLGFIAPVRWEQCYDLYAAMQ